MNRLRQLSAGVELFSSKNKELLPDLSSSEALYKDVYPYLKTGGNEVFIHPVTGEPYATNITASKRMNSGQTNDTFSATVDPSATVIIYEATPDSNGTRGVIYMDGRVTRVSENKWKSIIDASQIP